MILVAVALLGVTSALIAIWMDRTPQQDPNTIAEWAQQGMGAGWCRTDPPAGIGAIGRQPYDSRRDAPELWEDRT